MNCKQGDWAVIVNSIAKNKGVVVKCIRPYAGFETFFQSGKRWVIDKPLLNNCGTSIYSIADSCLLPLKTPSGDDLNIVHIKQTDSVVIDA